MSASDCAWLRSGSTRNLDVERRAVQRQRAHELRDARRPVQRERLLARVEAHRGEQSRQSEEMIAVQMGEEDRVDGAEANGAAHQLMLRPFAAIEEEDAAVQHHGDRGNVARARGHAGARAEKDDSDVLQNRNGPGSLCLPEPFSAR